MNFVYLIKFKANEKEPQRKSDVNSHKGGIEI